MFLDVSFSCSVFGAFCVRFTARHVCMPRSFWLQTDSFFFDRKIIFWKAANWEIENASSWKCIFMKSRSSPKSARPGRPDSQKWDRSTPNFDRHNFAPRKRNSRNMQEHHSDQSDTSLDPGQSAYLRMGRGRRSCRRAVRSWRHHHC